MLDVAADARQAYESMAPRTSELTMINNNIELRSYLENSSKMKFFQCCPALISLLPHHLVPEDRFIIIS
jgi:hypothetical protein